MTELLFRESPYERRCEAEVLGIDGNSLRLDRTIFYPMGGGQPGDTGTLTAPDGRRLAIVDTRKGDGANEIVHVLEGDAMGLAAGDRILIELDWERRHRHMRLHTCLHLLSAVLPYPVTGGQIAADKARLDFDIPEAILDKDAITAKLNELIDRNHPVGADWISDADLAAQPDLVKTMAVKPPIGTGRVRLVRIANLDLQPCGGTHVAFTGEIGPVAVTKIEKKGRLNRRVAIGFAD